MKVQKKGQLAVFIVLAIFIVILGVLVYLYLNRVQETGTTTTTEGAQIVSAEIRPAADLVQNCLDRYALQGVKILGLQGGYIYLPSDMPSDLFKNDRGEEVAAKGLTFEVNEQKKGFNQVPYWIAENKTAIPSTNFMERELGNYIDNSVLFCTNYFNDLKNQGMNITIGIPHTEVHMYDNVYVTLHWPLTLSLKGQVFTFDRSSTTVPVNFATIHNTAFTLATNELANTYLEQHALSLISLYGYSGGAKDSSTLPPMVFTDTNTNCNSVSWDKPSVKELFRSILHQNYPFLKINATNFTRILSSDPTEQGTYDSFIRDFTEPLPNIHVDFSSPSYQDIQFNVVSSNGGQSLAPERVSQTIPFMSTICTFKYQYKYSVSAPILVKIHDDNSMKLQGGFDFYFPMKMYLCGNQAHGCTGAPHYLANITSVNQVLGITAPLNILNCSNTNSTLNVSVRAEGSPAPNVDITEFCSDYLTDCYLGRTDSFGKLNTSLVKCSKPLLRLQKMGYATTESSLNLTYDLEPIHNYTLDLQLVKASTFLLNYYLSNGFTSIHPNCTSRYGSASSLLAATRSGMRKPTDKVIINFIGPTLETPTLIYPLQKNLRLNSGKFNLSTSYQGQVVIHPAEYGDDDHKQWISFNAAGSGDYSGLWMLGEISTPLNLTRNGFKGTSITLPVFVEHYSDEDLNVKSIENPAIQTDGSLYGTVTGDKNCDGKAETVTLHLYPKDYLNFIKPEFR